MPKRFFIDAGSVANLKKALAEFPPAYFVSASGEFLEQLGVLKEQMVKRSSNPPGPIPAGEGVHRQTGRLAGSWGVAVTGTAIADLKGAAFSFAGVKAPRLELGGDVQAPSGAGPTSGWIYVPTDINKRPSGEAIRTPGDVLSQGGSFINRRLRRFQDFPPAVIDGQSSPAWNLVISGNPFDLIQSAPMFIQAKSARYRPLLGFFDTGTKFADILPGNLANAAVKYWRETPL